MDVVAGEIKTDQPLEDNAPPRPGGSEKNQQAGGRAAVSHHVQDGAEGGGLIVASCRDSIESVEEAGYAVEQRTGAGVEWHVIERCDGKDDA